MPLFNSTNATQLWGVDVNTLAKRQLVVAPNDGDTEENLSLEEKLRRERQRLHATGVTSFFWSSRGSANIRIMVPLQVHKPVQNRRYDAWRPVRCKSARKVGCFDSSIFPRSPSSS